MTPTPSPSRRKQRLKRQRLATKIGMAASMGLLLYTGMRGKKAMVTHTWAGLALVGLSIWHWALYQPGAARLPAARRLEARHD